MIAAEKWYEYQENYKKYGLDMKPKQPKKRPKPRKAGMTAKDKVRVLAVMAIAGAICVGLIITTAYGATIKYENNKMIEANNAIAVEVEGLTRKVESAKNIKTIEKKATEELGMVTPKKKQLVYLSNSKKAKSGSAAAAKEKSYY